MNVGYWHCDVIFIDCSCMCKLVQSRSSMNIDFSPPCIHGLACKKVNLLTHICVTCPQWVNTLFTLHCEQRESTFSVSSSWLLYRISLYGEPSPSNTFSTCKKSPTNCLLAVLSSKWEGGWVLGRTNHLFVWLPNLATRLIPELSRFWFNKAEICLQFRKEILVEFLAWT